MGSLFKRFQVARPEAKEPETTTLLQSDDLLERATKIVHLLGFRGAVGDYILGVHDALKAYDQMDRDKNAEP